MAISVTKNHIFTIFKEYSLMALGMFIYSFGWICGILPAHSMGGGAGGVALLIHYLTQGGMPIGVSVLVINAILLLIAGFIVGWKFGIKTIYCILILSLSMSIMEKLATLPDGTIQSVFSVFQLQDRLLMVILGGLFAGVGVSMCFMQGGSTGGTDIIAMIINKYRKVSYGKIVRFTDSMIIASALLLPANSGVGLDGVIYGFIVTVVFSYAVDAILSGNQQSSQILIICKDYRAMADAMNNEAHRGATVIDSVGWYTKNNTKIVMVVCHKRETNTVLKTARKIDPEAFMTVGSVMGVYGRGFDALNKI